MSRKQAILFESIREELEILRLRFFQLLREIPDENWNIHPPGEDWTIKQEMFHIVQVVNLLPKGIKNASEGGKRSMLAIVPTNLRSWVNGHIVIPFTARNATRQSVAEEYDKAHKALLDTLEKIPEEAWSKGIPYPKKYRTIEQMAHRPLEHFEEHLKHLQNVLGVNAIHTVMVRSENE